MTPEEFCAKAQEILDTRPLKEWQEGDIHLYCRLVRRKGIVLPLDEFYLDFVGKPYPGYLMPKELWYGGKRKKAVKPNSDKIQGSLF